jgi:predicted RNase H-like nuclease (RuvC/YqgF family)
MRTDPAGQVILALDPGETTGVCVIDHGRVLALGVTPLWEGLNPPTW